MIWRAEYEVFHLCLIRQCEESMSKPYWNIKFISPGCGKGYGNVLTKGRTILPYIYRNVENLSIYGSDQFRLSIWRFLEMQSPQRSLCRYALVTLYGIPEWGKGAIFVNLPEISSLVGIYVGDNLQYPRKICIINFHYQ